VNFHEPAEFIRNVATVVRNITRLEWFQSGLLERVMPDSINLAQIEAAFTESNGSAASDAELAKAMGMISGELTDGLGTAALEPAASMPAASTMGDVKAFLATHAAEFQALIADGLTDGRAMPGAEMAEPKASAAHEILEAKDAVARHVTMDVADVGQVPMPHIDLSHLWGQ
jgi:hypothetical protein